MNGFGTQWRTEVLFNRIVYLGFDFAVLATVERCVGIECTPEIYHYLQVMELEAAKTRNKP